jgi:hypothetical protein
MSKIEQIISLIDQLEALDFEDTDRVDHMRPICDALHPLGITRIEFRTYQPSFNDGDPCTPSVLDALYLTVTREAHDKMVSLYQKRDADKGYEREEYDFEDTEHELYMGWTKSFEENTEVLMALGMDVENAQALLHNLKSTLELLDKLVNYGKLEINIKYSYAYNEVMNLRESGEEYYSN